MNPAPIRRVVAGLALTSVVGCSATAPSIAPATAAATAPSATVATTVPSVSPVASTVSSAGPTSAATPEASADASSGPEPSEEPLDGSATGGPDGCGTGRLGLFSHRDEVPKVLHFGGATIEFTTAGIGLRNSTYAADDVIPPGIGLTRDEIAVKVPPGTHILLRGDGIVLTEAGAWVVPWSIVSFDHGVSWTGMEAYRLPERARSDGSVSVSAPTDTGDDMVMFAPRYRSTCLRGDGVAYGRIKVVTP